MSAFSNVDRELFQNLLASAFAVQESGLDTKSLSALLELQESIAPGKPDVDRTMNQVADRARNVANADGIAIALVRGTQLVYRAGSGSGAASVGRNLTASLSSSAHKSARGEILRVDNAQTDGRIEGAICREYKAQSLLILPIYQGHAVGGVLEVFFKEAHCFQDQEVRTYRLMAAFVEEAIVHAADLDQKTLPAAQPVPLPHLVEQTPLYTLEFPRKDKSASGRAGDDGVSSVCGPGVSATGESEETRLPAKPAETVRQPRKVVRPHKLAHNIAVTALGMTLLVAACWISYIRSSVSPAGTSPLQRSSTTPQQTPFAVAKPSPSKGVSRLRTVKVGAEKTKAPSSAFRRVQVGAYEVDYIAEDVTVRHFLPHRAPRPALRGTRKSVSAQM